MLQYISFSDNIRLLIKKTTNLKRKQLKQNPRKNKCRKKEKKAVMHTVKCILNQKRDFKYNFRDIIFKAKKMNPQYD